MSIYKQRNGYSGSFDKPPTCDGCGIIISTHRSRWHKLWNKPVLICAPCRSLAHPAVLRKRLEHIRSLLQLEAEYAQAALTASRLRESTSPGVATTHVDADLQAVQHRLTVSAAENPRNATLTRAGQGSISEEDTLVKTTSAAN